ncbi:hypothetical protein BKA81DRAFT_376012 [Phyllosticta paracitricarpa]
MVELNSALASTTDSPACCRRRGEAVPDDDFLTFAHSPRPSSPRLAQANDAVGGSRPPANAGSGPEFPERSIHQCVGQEFQLAQDARRRPLAVSLRLSCPSFCPDTLGSISHRCEEEICRLGLRGVRCTGSTPPAPKGRVSTYRFRQAPSSAMVHRPHIHMSVRPLQSSSSF